MFKRKLFCFLNSLFLINSLHAGLPLSDEMVAIMEQPKYRHATWGLTVKNGATGDVVYELNANKMFVPGSTSKLFTTAALYNAYGTDYRFKTPVFAMGAIDAGKLTGDLVLVGQGDLTLGGRQGETNQIAFTDMDHIYANMIPGAILTPEDPLHGIKNLAKQVKEKGIQEINGDILIDDRLFETTEKRGLLLTPIMINENLIDIVLNPSEMGKTATFTWRPEVEGYTVKNLVTTVAKEGKLDIEVTSDESGKNIVVKGTIPLETKNILRTFSVKNAQSFARSAFIQALREQQIVVNLPTGKEGVLPAQASYKDLKPLAEWTSPPLTEYVKLILKVSHNVGADLIPLLLAAKKSEKSFDAGMKLLGDFIVNEVALSANAFVFIDGAGGDSNRLTPRGQIQILEYINKKYVNNFDVFFNALPILGVDGSLAGDGKGTPAAGKIRAKTGTGVSYNLATQQFFLTAQLMTGYIVAKDGQLFNYTLGVNNAQMAEIKDIYPILEDLSKISNLIYEDIASGY